MSMSDLRLAQPRCACMQCAVCNAVRKNICSPCACRRFKNRLAARKSRRGKAEEIHQLQDEDAGLAEKNAELQEKIKAAMRDLKDKEEEMTQVHVRFFLSSWFLNASLCMQCVTECMHLHTRSG